MVCLLNWVSEHGVLISTAHKLPKEQTTRKSTLKINIQRVIPFQKKKNINSSYKHLYTKNIDVMRKRAIPFSVKHIAYSLHVLLKVVLMYS